MKIIIQMMIKSDLKTEKIADDSIESIPFIAEPSKEKRSRSNK